MANPYSVFVEHFERVSVEAEESGYFYVAPVWRGVDRPNVGGWVVSSKIAGRLAEAVKAGAAFGRVEVKTDVNGATYVSAEHKVLGRHANADLRRLGY